MAMNGLGEWQADPGASFRREWPARCTRCVMVFLVLVALAALPFPLQGQERTSKTDERLAKFLERNPEADGNKDGVLTMEEVKAYRAKQGGKRRGGPPRQPAVPPTHADVPYGPHERNVIDFWQAKSDNPTPVLVFFHGGGFRAGDKKGYNRSLFQSCMDSGISFAAANYRLSSQAKYPAQMHDCARAIQFLRHKAKEWNIDPTRIAAFGGSAGSGISLWLNFHDDMADPNSDDPVARQSTRLTCAIGLQMQSTYDPREIKKVVPGKAYNHPALKQLFGVPDDFDWDTGEISEELSDKMKDASSITHLTKDDPPAFLFHRKQQERDGNIHHANFGRHLKKAMDELGIECIHRMDTDYENVADAFKEMAEFVKRHFGIK